MQKRAQYGMFLTAAEDKRGCKNTQKSIQKKKKKQILRSA